MKCIWIFLFCCFSLQFHAQNENEVVKFFDSIVASSNAWEGYRVIKKDKLSAFKQELTSNNDSLISSIISLEKRIETLEKEISDSQKENQILQKKLTTSKNSKDEISFIGIAISKETYSSVVWSIIGVLFIALIFIFIRFRNSNIVTQELKENLKSTNSEFEQYKHRAIEKQQKRGRDLLDAQKKAQIKNNRK